MYWLHYMLLKVFLFNIVFTKIMLVTKYVTKVSKKATLSNKKDEKRKKRGSYLRGRSQKKLMDSFHWTVGFQC